MDVLKIVRDKAPSVQEESSTEESKSKISLRKMTQAERLNFLQKKLGVETSFIEDHKFKPSMVKGNVENLIGSIEIPLGLAGPLEFNFEDSKEEVFTPVATSEGALVASICRGAKAINLSGGVNTSVTRSVMTRCPFFKCENHSQALKIYTWFKNNLENLKKKSEDYSNYIELIDIKPKFGAGGVALRFEFETGDASGQNMSTVCTWNLCKEALEQIKKEPSIGEIEFFIEGNWSSDKKASYSSAIEGRGKEVISDAIIKKEVAEDFLKIKVKDFVKTMQQLRANSSFNGIIGFQVNVANVLAGIFAATGQDLACVSECAIANFYFEETKSGDLYISLHMPNVLVGTVGGGTSLPAFKSMLEVMDCSGSGKAERFARIIGGYALALELSTASAICNGTFAQAHDRLGRNRNVEWLKFCEIEPEFFNKHGHFENEIVEISRDHDFSTDKSLISELVAPVTRRVSGIFKYDLKDSKKEETDIILKIKPKEDEVYLALLILAGLEDLELRESLLGYKEINMFKNCHVKEQMIYNEYNEEFQQIFPKTYGTIVDNEREIFLLMNEYLKDYKFIDLNNPKFFKAEDYTKNVIRAITPFHALNYGKKNYKRDWLNDPVTFEQMSKAKPVWKKLLSYANENFKDIVSDELFNKHNEAIERLEEWAKVESSFKTTLIHCDFNPRNIGYRSLDGAVKIIDWELARIGLPQRDIVELLAYTTDEEFSLKCLKEHIAFHKKEFEYCLQEKVSEKEWLESYKCALDEFIVHRLPLYFIAHAHKDCEFLPALYTQSHHLLSLMRQIEV